MKTAFLLSLALCAAAPARAAGVVVKSIGYQLIEGEKFPAFYAHLLGKDFVASWQQYQQANPTTAQEMFLDGASRPQSNDFASVTLENDSDSPVDGLRLQMTVEGFSEPATQSVPALKPGESATLSLTPAFTDKVYAAQESAAANVDTKLLDAQGNVLFEKTRRITILSKDYMVWGIDSDYDLAYGIAGFVTPHDSGKAIDKLLSAAADKAPGRALGGYQGDDHQLAVEQQAKAIYDTIHEMGVKYVNAPISFGKNDQRVKLPAESLADKSGNCIEGTLLFASAFESLGMRPVVILVPGHAFVGVRLWDDDDTILPIETTMVGTDPYKDAVKTAIDELNQYLGEGTATIVDVTALRQMGVTPSPS